MNFGFLLFEDAEELDLVGPWEIINVWRKYAGGPENCVLVGPRVGEVRCAKSMSVNAEVSYTDCLGWIIS